MSYQSYLYAITHLEKMMWIFRKVFWAMLRFYNVLPRKYREQVVELIIISFWEEINAMKKKTKIEKVMHEYKEGTLKSSSGKKVRSRKQAIAIAISESKKKK